MLLEKRNNFTAQAQVTQREISAIGNEKLTNRQGTARGSIRASVLCRTTVKGIGKVSLGHFRRAFKTVEPKSEQVFIESFRRGIVFGIRAVPVNLFSKQAVIREAVSNHLAPGFREESSQQHRGELNRLLVKEKRIKVVSFKPKVVVLVVNLEIKQPRSPQVRSRRIRVVGLRISFMSRRVRELSRSKRVED